MEEELEKAIYNYVVESELYGELPIFWMDCQKNEDALRQTLADRHEIKNDSLVDYAVSEIIKTYDQQVIEFEKLGYASEEHTLDDWVRDELNHQLLVYRVKAESGQCNGEEQLGGLDNEKSMYDYVSDCDLYAILPVYWIECGKNRQELKKHIASEYLIDNEEIIGDIMSEVVDTYEQALAQKEDMAWDSDDHDDLEGELDEDALFDLTLIEMFHEEEWLIKANEVHQNRKSGVFFTVREADGEYVFNPLGWILVGLGVFLLFALIESAG